MEIKEAIILGLDEYGIKIESPNMMHIYHKILYEGRMVGWLLFEDDHLWFYSSHPMHRLWGHEYADPKFTIERLVEDIEEMAGPGRYW